MKELTNNEAKIKAAQLCAGRERSPLEIEKKLLSWKIAKDEANAIINFLKTENYLDDQRYALAFANDKIKFGKWGKNKVFNHLRMSGIDEKYAQKAIENFDNKEYYSIIKYEIEKKATQINKKNEQQRYNAIVRFALGRGYEYEIVEPIINKIQTIKS